MLGRAQPVMRSRPKYGDETTQRSDRRLNATWLLPPKPSAARRGARAAKELELVVAADRALHSASHLQGRTGRAAPSPCCAPRRSKPEPVHLLRADEQVVLSSDRKMWGLNRRLGDVKPVAG